MRLAHVDHKRSGMNRKSVQDSAVLGHFAKLDAKSEDSIADLPVDPEFMDVFRKYFAGAKGSFVIRSHRPPLPPRPRQYFRCHPIFDRLVAWLRQHGLNGNKPLHTLIRIPRMQALPPHYSGLKVIRSR